MSLTTLGVKLDESVRERLKKAAAKVDRTPHWLIKHAIYSHLEMLERGLPLADVFGDGSGAANGAEATSAAASAVAEREHQPFLDFAENVLPQSVLRAAITAAYRRPEAEQVSMLLPQARLPGEMAAATHRLACSLSEKLRNHQAAGRAGVVQNLLQEFALSSQEGVALMCLAEALLRIPDRGTRDALIRDKISNGNWQPHLGKSTSLFVNAATWGLMLTGKLVATHNESGLSHSLGRVLTRGGEPVVRKGVDMAMRLMGEQFVTGETIGKALANAGKLEARGFRYSYDMLGEAALTDADALRYMASYEQAIHAIGMAASGAGIYRGPGISIKLSALHPRYSRAQYPRVMDELYPRLLSLTLLARKYDIGLNIDAEEADRLELSLDLLERLCHESALAGWNGIGFVIQAYQKRCASTIAWLVDLARRSRHRLMIRLVKGAYWDSEVKRAQVDGLEDYPVYTRKVHTDVSYLACARQLLAVPEAVYPQFATHNAHTMAAIYHLAGQNYYEGQYEFQCLHGMGEPLYDQVVGPVAEGKLGRPCRIYAPVGSHQTLLAYLVRRLLENGANTSFVNRIADKTLSIESLVADPVAVVEAQGLADGVTGLPHPRIALPRALYADRANAAGLDLSNEQRLGSLASALLQGAGESWFAQPLLGQPAATGGGVGSGSGGRQAVRNPARHDDIVGHVQDATAQDVQLALQSAQDAFQIWQATPAAERADMLERAADLLEGRMQPLLGLLVRESGKTLANAISEVREAVDFLHYYAARVRQGFSNDTHRPLGPVVCISPWNFPLAIFTGQVAAALAAGNTVLAKPAEQTPLIAAQAVKVLHDAGLPPGVLQLLPGTGETVGAALVADARVQGVMFTGSTQVARILQRVIAGRLDAQGRPIPLVAETGGQNAMIVDSSALVEQVVTDVIASAFDSAGQRCSALRILCVQEDIAERTIEMLQGAMAECTLGNPEHLCVDIGPVIDLEAKQALERHIEAMRAKGRRVFQVARAHGGDTLAGTFVTPTLIEIAQIDELDREVFGPVLHVLRYARTELDALLDQINATGYGLTLGVHSRIDETIQKIVSRVKVGNLYVNRNMVGAVVGVQPFGGEGLSGTGPKAGGPLYLNRLLSSAPACGAQRDGPLSMSAPLAALRQWCDTATPPRPELAALCERYAGESRSGTELLLDGPTGERNAYRLSAREAVLCLAASEADLLCQLAAVLSVGARAAWPHAEAPRALAARLPAEVRAALEWVGDWSHEGAFTAVIHHGDSDQLRGISEQLALRPGPIVGLQGLAPGDTGIVLERLLIERSLSVNTAAAGGNASLMSVG
ncbi:trifunctional transcriptional regulator/proline dehydrogenase/L-glutamate gamma-semialdehyde dehydrogenase [Variovorax sp. J22G73]|uniref:trifunctional transcriptional regulator/proline dehydrogenase/L-glutamate gamma-semialdehyde dehydrogenase n=1 Tax=unclassified Variovorax TaxID=663243 RepID=UPI002575605C|nr:MULTISPECIES: trifunctional transcriptional regulator/proline dehydrogenase/L-glutamate gamma-semialdehyde dehydrogenase [unclassified Variovorax]MDM0005371.1 trifunctional transcriptional regulator/proline dehydrogenase/L-glutamate gamma-semialdehyde dehydrogenase [Variovorax sp. J22R203]MDM0098787.1 trifunctional transcriptional regulator/proline dehydrogenase/L-glutamate gamma-semialdehyde dehydrogenase [Variovorax sp. J22G73]